MLTTAEQAQLVALLQRTPVYVVARRFRTSREAVLKLAMGLPGVRRGTVLAVRADLAGLAQEVAS